MSIYTNGLIDVEIVQPDPLCVNGTISYYVGDHGYPRHRVESLADVDEFRLSLLAFCPVDGPAFDEFCQEV